MNKETKYDVSPIFTNCLAHDFAKIPLQCLWDIDWCLRYIPSLQHCQTPSETPTVDKELDEELKGFVMRGFLLYHAKVDTDLSCCLPKDSSKSM